MHENPRIPNHKLAVARHFNRSANSYHETCFLERELGNRLLERLDFIKQDPITILDLGGGTGWGSEKLSLRYPKATVFNLDLAEYLLQQPKYPLQGSDLDSGLGSGSGSGSNPDQDKPFKSNSNSNSKLINPCNIIRICGDAELLPFGNNTIDFIFSNCVLHWCYNLSTLLQEIHRVLKPEGLFLFSTLGPDTLKELRESFYATDTELHVNNFMDMHLIGDALLQTQFLDPVMDSEWLTCTFSTVEELIGDIRKSGSSYVFRKYIPGLSPKSLYRNLSKNYEQFRLDSGQLPATIEIVYGHAWGSSNIISSNCHASGEETIYRIPISEIHR